MAGFEDIALMEIPERQGQPRQEDGDRKPRASESEDENKRIRRLQIMMNMVTSVLSQEDMSVEEAMELVANAKRAALAMFPDKELAYDLIYKPRLQLLVRERFRLQ